jgi:hypothetical protein
MEIQPIGYSSRIKRKGPGPVVAVLVIIALGLSIYFFITEYSRYKEVTASLTDSTDGGPESQGFRSGDTTGDEWTVTEFDEEKKEEKVEEEEVDKSDSLVNEIDTTLTADLANNAPVKKIAEGEKEKLGSLKTKSENSEVEKKEKVVEEKKLSSAPTTDNKSKLGKTEPIPGNYYIIISSVDTKSAAEKQKEKYNSLSLKTEIIYISKQNRYRLSIGRYSTMQQASTASKDIKSKHPDHKTWIWKAL